MDAESGGELEHLEDLVRRRSERDRAPRVRTYTIEVSVSGGCVPGQVAELFELVTEIVLVPRDLKEIQ
jgi:hypothetical protein